MPSLLTWIQISAQWGISDHLRELLLATNSSLAGWRKRQPLTFPTGPFDTQDLAVKVESL